MLEKNILGVNKWTNINAAKAVESFGIVFIQISNTILSYIHQTFQQQQQKETFHIIYLFISCVGWFDFNVYTFSQKKISFIS